MALKNKKLRANSMRVFANTHAHTFPPLSISVCLLCTNWMMAEEEEEEEEEGFCTNTIWGEGAGRGGGREIANVPSPTRRGWLINVKILVSFVSCSKKAFGSMELLNV